MAAACDNERSSRREQVIETCKLLISQQPALLRSNAARWRYTCLDFHCACTHQQCFRVEQAAEICVDAAFLRYVHNQYAGWQGLGATTLAFLARLLDANPRFTPCENNLNH